MKKHIAEDLPARKFPQASLSKGGGDRDRQGGDRDREGGESKTPEKRVRQAVYDIKYRARRENIPLRAAYTQYMQNSSMSEQEKAEVRRKLFGDIGGGSPDRSKKFVKAFKKPGMQAEDFSMDMKVSASNSMAKALYNVFVEKKNDEVDYDQLKDELEEAAHFNKYRDGDKKYKVRVTDKNGTSYVRFATREKINSLRANPNIDSVEMTEYGQPYEGERTKGERTAAATAGKDWDKDGKKESPPKEYRGVVHNAIQSSKGGTPDGKDTSSVKEEFLGELNNEDTIDVKSKKKPNNIKVYHKSDGDMTESSYSKFLGLLNEREMTKGEVTKEKKLKGKYDDSDMKASMIRQYGEEKGKRVYFATIRKQAMKEESCGSDNKSEKGETDERQDATKRSLIRTKLGSMGINKAVIMSASYKPEGELVDESRLGDKAKKIEDDEAKKGGLRRTRSNREKIAGNIRRSQNVDSEGDLGRQKAPKDTGLHKGATRSSSEDEDDETPKRRKRDDNPALTVRERNPNLR